MVKLVYLVTDLEIGGVPLILRDRVRAIRDLGDFSPIVVSLASRGPVGEMLRKDGIPVIGLGAKSVSDLPRVLRNWNRLLHEVRPAIVHSILIHANGIATLGQQCGPPAVYVQELQTTQSRPRWHWWLQGMIAGRCDVLITPSRAVLDKLSHYGAVQRGIVIPNGVDVARFRDAMPIPMQQRPWPAGSRVVGYVGRLDPVKGLNLLLDAVALLSRNQGINDLRLAIIGYGEEEIRLREQAQMLGISPIVHFCGPTKAPEHWYKSFDLFCLPSWSEGCPMSLIEAMAAGTPVLAASNAAITEIIRPNVDGSLIAKPTHDCLAIAIKEVMDDDATTKTHAANAQKRSEQFSVERIVAEHNKILKKIVKK